MNASMKPTACCMLQHEELRYLLLPVSLVRCYVVWQASQSWLIVASLETGRISGQLIENCLIKRI